MNSKEDAFTESHIHALLTESNAIEFIREPVSTVDVAVATAFLSHPSITVEDLESIAYYFQHDARLRDGVKAFGPVKLPGGYEPPEASELVTHKLENILQRLNNLKKQPLSYQKEMEAFYTHLEYEQLHPFSDCNGRTGRMLLFWVLDCNLDGMSFLHWWYMRSFRT